MYRLIAAITITVIFVSSCGLSAPRPSESDFFQSAGGGFLIDNSKKVIKYGLTLKSKKDIKEGSLILSLFENPEGGEALTAEHIVTTGEKEFILQSPPVQGLKAHTNYSIEVSLYSDSSKEKLVSTHKQDIQSIFNQSDLRW